MVKAFISYSWESEGHSLWVRALADRLRSDGIESHLDQWAIGPGDSIPQFMETSVREIDFVIAVCTPFYKAKFDDRLGGVGGEAELIAAEAFVFANRRKFVPILRSGEWPNSAPSFFLGTYYVDLRGKDDVWPKKYKFLVDTLQGRRPEPPPVKSQGLRLLDDGTIFDEATNLIWAGCRDERVVGWDDCQQSLRQLGITTGLEWRLPTEDEVKAVISLEQDYTAKPIMASVDKFHPFFGKYTKTPWTPTKVKNVKSMQVNGFYTPRSFPIPGIDPYHAAAEANSIGSEFLARFVRNNRGPKLKG